MGRAGWGPFIPATCRESLEGSHVCLVVMLAVSSDLGCSCGLTHLNVSVGLLASLWGDGWVPRESSQSEEVEVASFLLPESRS